jgi:hypothetical protein
MTDPDLFIPLKQPAREALSAMIDGAGIARSDTPGLIFAEPNAAALRVVGFGPDIADEIANQVRTKSPSALNLFKLGLAGEVAMAIGRAINDRFAPTPVIDLEPVKPASSGAMRGAVKPKAWRNKKGSYLVGGAL